MGSESRQLPASMSPVPVPERIIHLDILRGFALLGILVVNLLYFSSPIFLEVGSGGWFTGPLDKGAKWLIQFLFENKFVTLFSFLFGVGMALQLQRASARQRPFLPLYLRRTFLLLLIGLGHGLFLWMGDILTAYGMLGFLLLLFRNRTARTLKVWTVILLLAPVLVSTLFVGLVQWGRSMPEASAQIEAEFSAQTEQYLRQAEQARIAYGQGTWAELHGMRRQEFAFMYTGMLIGGTFFYLLGIFLVGLQVGRSSLLHQIPQHLPLVRRLFGWGLAIGVPVNLLYAVVAQLTNRANMEPATVLYLACMVVGAPALALAYACGVVLLSHRAGWGERMARLAPMGQMALSNYLLQSVVGTTLYYSYGLGLYGQVGPALNLLIAAALFALQIPLSVWWLARFRYGPAEWLWRSFTYWRWQPMRL